MVEDEVVCARNDRVLTMVKTLRQTGNVCDYIYEFEKLMNQINGMSELDKASNFITGLQDNIAAYVTLFDKGDTLIGAKQEAL